MSWIHEGDGGLTTFITSGRKGVTGLGGMIPVISSALIKDVLGTNQ
jgi:hypothetical protein